MGFFNEEIEVRTYLNLIAKFKFLDSIKQKICFFRIIQNIHHFLRTMIHYQRLKDQIRYVISQKTKKIIRHSFLEKNKINFLVMKALRKFFDTLYQFFKGFKRYLHLRFKIKSLIKSYLNCFYQGKKKFIL